MTSASKKLVLCKLSFYGNFGVKARIIAERKLMRIALIRINLRSLQSTILRSFHARNYHKNLVYRALGKFDQKKGSARLSANEKMQSLFVFLTLFLLHFF